LVLIASLSLDGLARLPDLDRFKSRSKEVSQSTKTVAMVYTRLCNRNKILPRMQWLSVGNITRRPMCSRGSLTTVFRTQACLLSTRRPPSWIRSYWL